MPSVSNAKEWHVPEYLQILLATQFQNRKSDLEKQAQALEPLVRSLSTPTGERSPGPAHRSHNRSVTIQLDDEQKDAALDVMTKLVGILYQQVQEYKNSSATPSISGSQSLRRHSSGASRESARNSESPNRSPPSRQHSSSDERGGPRMTPQGRKHTTPPSGSLASIRDASEHTNTKISSHPHPRHSAGGSDGSPPRGDDEAHPPGPQLTSKSRHREHEIDSQPYRSRSTHEYHIDIDVDKHREPPPPSRSNTIYTHERPSRHSTAHRRNQSSPVWLNSQPIRHGGTDILGPPRYTGDTQNSAATYPMTSRADGSLRKALKRSASPIDRLTDHPQHAAHRHSRSPRRGLPSSRAQSPLEHTRHQSSLNYGMGPHATGHSHHLRHDGPYPHRQRSFAGHHRGRGRGIRSGQKSGRSAWLDSGPSRGQMRNRRPFVYQQRAQGQPALAGSSRMGHHVNEPHDIGHVLQYGEGGQ